MTNEHTKQRKRIKRTQRTIKEINEKKARKQRNTIDILCKQCQGKWITNFLQSNFFSVCFFLFFHNKINKTFKPD